MRDILYGAIDVPSELEPFLKIPEFVRLRGVRLSNVDSVEFKDFGGPSRWEHAVGVLHLAQVCAHVKGLARTDAYHLYLAALLHDIATPPFAHTAEYVLRDFDHELETARLLSSQRSEDVFPDAAIYLSETPQFRDACATLARRARIRVDPDEVGAMVVGEGQYGYLISGTLDLDNADNVTRASLYMGLGVDGSVPVRLAEYLGSVSAAPLDLDSHSNPAIRQWLTYRRRMYGSFYNASTAERGREAFLQHLFRRAIAANVPRRSLVWNTDDGFLNLLSSLEDTDDEERVSTRELVRRYRLLETPSLLTVVEIEDPDTLRILKLAAAAAWIEEQLTTDYLEAVVSVAARRFIDDGDDQQMLLPQSAGQLSIYKVGSGFSHGMLPAWLQELIPRHYANKRLLSAVQKAVSSRLPSWVRQRPWLEPSVRRAEQARARLESIGDWSFRESRNLSLHTYPSTFVQAIPASLIHALDVAGELVLDPFGGTGNTAIEAVKAGGTGISADSNSIATLIASVRSRHLSMQLRDQVRSLSRSSVEEAPQAPQPETLRLTRWHHPATIEQLRSILGFIHAECDENLRDFYYLAFSAILPSTTARRGEQHGFFADNTPLPRGLAAPPFVDAVQLFLDRINANVARLEVSYASLEHDGGSAARELQRFKVVQADVVTATPATYGVDPRSVAAIITSPPYLCMTDYTLGHRLSYDWLPHLDMGLDFAAEIGSRRSRLTRPSEVNLANYLEGMATFLSLARELLRPGGYLALVLGASQARAFEDADVFGSVESLLLENGFESTWNSWRNISWARNHGYARLRRERLSVHRLL